MQSTAQYFINRCQSAQRWEVVPTSSGWLLRFYLPKMGYPVDISYLPSPDGDRFIVVWPLGNKIHDEFFSADDRKLLLDYFKELVDG